MQTFLADDHNIRARLAIQPCGVRQDQCQINTSVAFGGNATVGSCLVACVGVYVSTLI